MRLKRKSQFTKLRDLVRTQQQGVFWKTGANLMHKLSPPKTKNTRTLYFYTHLGEFLATQVLASSFTQLAILTSLVGFCFFSKQGFLYVSPVISKILKIILNSEMKRY